MERGCRPGRQTACREIELLDHGAKRGGLEFLIKAGLARISVVAPLMMMNCVSHYYTSFSIKGYFTLTVFLMNKFVDGEI